MCGIAGAVWTEAAPPLERRVLEQMTDALAHRGPDDRGFYLSAVASPVDQTPHGGVALGMRRLAIIDQAGGQQPISNEDGTVWIVFNGEIYNYRQLRLRQEGAGHRFRTHSDTETIVHLYEDLGPECLKHLNGMFALAIWDSRREQLLLARDRLGKKPLVYRHDGARLLFASELKSILSVPGVPRELDPTALDEYLTYQYVPHPRTIFRGVAKLPPGHYATFERGKLTVDSYWQPDFNVERPLPAEEYRRLLRETLTSAVAMRLESEVPLGAFLSGGIDSSIIVGLMQQAADQRVKTYSIGFPVPEFDETQYAWQVARHLGTDHHQFQVEPNAVEILPKLVWHYDEPFADSSAIPTYYVSQFTRRDVTVALSGDGGDELFAGYPRYRAVRFGQWFDKLPEDLRRLAGARFWERLPTGGSQKSPMRRFKRLLEGLAQSPEQRYYDWISIFNETRRAALYRDEFLAQLPNSDPFAFLQQAFARSSQRDPITATSLADLTTYLPCDLMTKVDIASMANSLECRQPFLDFRVVELAAAMPVWHKFRRLRGKRILLETFGDLLPPAVRRRSKMGFGVPLGHWFRHELKAFAHDVLFDSQTVAQPYFRPEAVGALWDEHQAARFDHSARLWALLFFELWRREWLR